jgi:hypothetical protein
MEELAWTAMRLGKNTIIQDPNPMGSYVGYIFPFGALAYASQYYAAKVGGVLGFTAALDGRGVLKMARERFWHQETIGDETVSYYYDPDPSHYSVRMDAYGNGPMLAALALAYGTTHIRTYSIQATSLLDSFDAFLWDRYRGGYWENLSRLDYKGLSSNVAFLRAILDLYDATGRPDLLNQAREILVFIERDLFIEDTDKPGFLLCSHDWIPFRGPTTTHFCTGCNFALLEGIFRLNELVQEGPTYPDRIPVCGTVPGEEPPWKGLCVYALLLAVPVVWIQFTRRKIRSSSPLLPALALPALLLGACDTCVGVKVTMDRVPIEGSYVELLDEEGSRMHEGWTDAQREICFSGLPMGQALTVRSSFDSRTAETPFQSGEEPEQCSTGRCPIVQLNFPCEHGDDLEPNDTLFAAAPVELPYANPLAALCPQGDIDFYRLEINEPDLNLVATVMDSATGEWMDRWVGLFDANGGWLDGRSGSSVTMASPLPLAGTYFLAVTHGDDYGFWGEHDHYGTYALDLRLVPSSCVELTVLEDGSPVQGAWVRTAEYPYDSCDTGSLGTCCLPAVEGMEVRYVIRHPHTGEDLDVSITPGSPGNCNEGNCEQVNVDFDYTCIQGAVTRGGVAVENARVESLYGQASTDLSGAYCIRAPKGQAVSVHVEDPDLCIWVEQSVETLSDGTCEGGGCTELDFEWEEPACVSGTVSRDGVPVQGAWVSGSFGCPPSFPTGPDGSFCLRAPANTDVSITVRDPLFHEDQDVQVQTGEGGSCETGGCSEVEVQLAGRACVGGTVWWHDGGPAASIRVNGPVDVATTASDGTYCLEAPRDRDVTVEIYHSLYDFYEQWDVHTDTAGSCGTGSCTQLDIFFPPTSCISGVVSREGGGPVMGTSVCIQWTDICAEPDPDGRYCLRTPIGEAVGIVLDDAVTGAWEERSLEGGPEGSCLDGNCAEANFELPTVACVRGVVSREGEPVPGAEVCSGYGRDVCVTSDLAGEYCLPAAASSGVQVLARDPVLGETQYGYTETGLPGSCETGDCATADLELRGATCIQGVVREGTEPLDGADVRNQFGHVYTNGEGRYCLPALANAAEWIRAGHPADNSEIVRYPATNNGGRCGEGGCTAQNFTFD